MKTTLNAGHGVSQKVGTAASFSEDKKALMVAFLKGVTVVRVPSFLVPVVAASSLVLLVTSVAACSSSKDAATSGTFTVNFTTYRVAIATSEVRAFVFDAQGKEDVCAQLIDARGSQSPWPAPLLASSGVTSPCGLLQTPNSVQLPEVEYGDRAIVVVGSTNGTDVVSGCQRVSLGEGNLSIPVTVAVVPNAVVPATTCASLSEYCNNNKQCP